MLLTQGYAAITAKAALQPFSFERHEVGPQDVLITITHCGICHSDIHQARDEWGGSIFPMVPGHEIVGTITQLGSGVKQFHVGETAGVGCFVDSCRTCPACLRDWSNIAKPGCFSLTAAATKTASLRKAVTPHRLWWMKITCCGFPQPCRLPEQHRSCARELQRTPRFATGASASITSLRWWDWVD
jgi:hypothetical protein